MPIYRTQFERFNFDFDPPLKQISDVVFQCDAPNDDENYQVLSGAAWSAMWKQNAGWDNYESPIEGYGGWSSVMGGHKFEEVVDIGLDFDMGVAGEGLPRIAETFTRKGKGDTSYRVTGFYKTYVPTELADNFTTKLLDKILAEERADMTDEERAYEENRMKIMQCTREEAEFVSGSGCIARIQDITMTGRVNWGDRTIARARRDYKVIDDMPTKITMHWKK